MIETILIAIGIALALSVDAFLACFAYATNQKNINTSFYYTPIFIGVLHFSFPFVTFTFCSLFKEELNTIGNYLGGSIFILLGLLCFFNKEENKNPVLNFIGVILLSVGVSIDSLLVGVSLSFSLTTIILPALIFGIISCFSTYLAFFLGKKVHKINFNFDILAGIFFIFLGLLTFFDLL